MKMNWEIFGLIAGAITASGFVPQIIKGYRTKKLDDISYFLGILIATGMFMWMIYGIHINSLSVIVANILGVCFNLILIVMKYAYARKSISPAENA